jgi:hypothetical protein
MSQRCTTSHSSPVTEPGRLAKDQFLAWTESWSSPTPTAIKLACLSWSFGLRSRGLEGFPGRSVPKGNPHTLFVTIPTRGGYMDILAQLKAARDKAAFELGRLEAAVSALSGASRSVKTTNTRRKMSASARRKISLAQKARWAKQNNGQADLRPKRHVSAASRRKMAIAQRARWARFNQRTAA